MCKEMKFEKTVISAVICIAVLMGIFTLVFTYTPAKWIMRSDCLCYRAHFHAGEHFALDDQLFALIDSRSFSDGNAVFLNAVCPHQESMWIFVNGQTDYYVMERATVSAY